MKWRVPTPTNVLTSVFLVIAAIPVGVLVAIIFAVASVINLFANLVRDHDNSLP